MWDVKSLDHPRLGSDHVENSYPYYFQSVSRGKFSVFVTMGCLNDGGDDDGKSNDSTPKVSIF